MKNILKVLGITVLAVVIGFSLIACPDGGGGGKKGEEEDEGFVNNLGSITIDLVDNFQYGEGYQAVYTAAALFKGKQVKEGDEYTLQITFKASRDLTDLLYVGLVDPSQEADYWKKLTAEGEDDGELIAGAEDDKIILKDEEVSVTIKMTAIASSTGAAAAKNALVFQTKSDDGEEGKANSGTLGKITLTFSEFIFAKGEIDEVPEPPPPPPPPGEDFPVELGEPDDVEDDAKMTWNLNWDDFTEAKYFIVETEGEGDNSWGFGTIQFILQGDGDGWTWNQTETGNWNGLPGQKTVGVTTYIVVELSALEGYDAVIEGTQGKIVVAYYGGTSDVVVDLGFVNAYLADESLTPSGEDLENADGDVIGFITQDAIFD